MFEFDKFIFSILKESEYNSPGEKLQSWLSPSGKFYCRQGISTHEQTAEKLINLWRQDNASVEQIYNQYKDDPRYCFSRCLFKMKFLRVTNGYGEIYIESGGTPPNNVQLRELKDLAISTRQRAIEYDERDVENYNIATHRIIWTKDDI